MAERALLPALHLGERDVGLAGGKEREGDFFFGVCHPVIVDIRVRIFKSSGQSFDVGLHTTDMGSEVIDTVQRDA
jgi:hypothetical protein